MSISTAVAVADDILKIAKQKNISLAPLQLMKLVYIAHGWSLALLNDDLFADRIEAWKYGPIVPELYHATKRFGRDHIPREVIGDDSSYSLSGDALELVKQVVEKYGHLTGYRLSQMTHRAGTPWSQLYKEGCYGIEIPDDVIKTHYKELARARAS